MVPDMMRHPVRAPGWVSATVLIVLAFVLWGWQQRLRLLLVYIYYRRDPASKNDRLQEAPLGPGRSSGGRGRRP
jgi:hypothetical protein